MTTQAQQFANTETLEQYIQAGGNPHSPENQRILADLVSREVGDCVSFLISHFAQNQYALDGSDYSWEDDILPLCEQRPDHSGRLVDIKDERTELEDDILELEIDRDDEDDESRVAELQQEINSCQQRLQQLADERDKLQAEMDDPQEVYEHWTVSNFLARKLAARDEAVHTDFFGLTIWGRTCSGQAIKLDHVIAEIAAEMGILVGQRNAWTD